MKAVVINEYGSRDVLIYADYPAPLLGGREVPIQSCRGSASH
jgi:hypothetical protein